MLLVQQESGGPSHRNAAPAVSKDRRTRLKESGSSSLELVLLAPVLIFLVMFVLWAGRSGRVALVTDLAASEAAVVAALACEPRPDKEECREQVVQDVLRTRPGLDFLCIDGPRAQALGGSGEFVDEAWLQPNLDGVPEFKVPIAGAARGVGVLGVRFACETDGAVAPLRGLLPTVNFMGQASEVVIGPPTIGP